MARTEEGEGRRGGGGGLVRRPRRGKRPEQEKKTEPKLCSCFIPPGAVDFMSSRSANRYRAGERIGEGRGGEDVGGVGGGQGCSFWAGGLPVLPSVNPPPSPSLPNPLGGEKKAQLGMCYLDVAADAEGLPLGGEEGVRHLLRGGLNGLLDLLLGDTLMQKGGCREHTRDRVEPVRYGL